MRRRAILRPAADWSKAGVEIEYRLPLQSQSSTQQGVDTRQSSNGNVGQWLFPMPPSTRSTHHTPNSRHLPRYACRPPLLLLGVSSPCTPSTPQLGSTTASRGSHISPHHPPFRQRNPRERSTITPWPSPTVESTGKRHDGTPTKPGVAIVNHRLQPRSDIVPFLCCSPSAALGAPCADPMIGRELLSAVQLSHCPRIHSRASAPRVSSKKRHPCRSEPSNQLRLPFSVFSRLPASVSGSGRRRYAATRCSSLPRDRGHSVLVAALVVWTLLLVLIE